MRAHQLPLRLATALLAAVSLGSACATEIVGLGSQRCREFVAVARNKQSAQAAGYLAWSQGFMSAVNLSRNAHKLHPKKFDQPQFSTEQQFASLSAYCEKNRENSFASAVISVYRQVPETR
jgi:hypothetical protein